MKFLPLYVGLLVVLASNLTLADEVCESATTQAQINECAAEAYQAADQQLNNTYQALTERLEANESAVEQLRVAQRAWISFRDAECEFASKAVQGGSAEPMVRNQCLAKLTEHRATALEEHAHCEEGDLSCQR